MKKLLSLILLAVVGFGMTAEAVKFKNRRLNVTAYEAEYIDPEVLKCIMNIADTIFTVNYKKGLAAVYEMQAAIERGDTLEAASLYRSNGPYSAISSAYLVVVNNKTIGNEAGFTIYMLPDGQLSPRIFDIERWNINRVRKYGYAKIFGYRVLFVDDAKGRNYFTVDDKHSKEIELVDNGYDVDTAIIIEGDGVAVYEEVDGKLQCLGISLPWI